MQLYLLYSGSQEDEDMVWGVYDSYDGACYNAIQLMKKIFKVEFHHIDSEHVLRWESDGGHYHIYIDEETLNGSVLD